ncbi:MAG: choice-of-anchor L domain-containing protein [Bacteroidales bacterium]
MKKILSFLGIIGLFVSANAQVSVNTTVDIDSAVRHILAGTGIEILNVSIDAVDGSWGIFSSETDLPIGFNEGIILTTGQAANVFQDDAELSTYNDKEESEFITNDYPNALVYDEAVISIEFTSQLDELHIDIVYASQNYPSEENDLNQDFFDPIGLYLSDETGHRQFAYVPNTYDQLISNETINNGPTNEGPCQNCDYYAGGAEGVAYNGYTEVISLSTWLTPGQTYTLNIAIADLWEPGDDSGIFLKAKSLRAICAEPITNEIEVELCEGETYYFNGVTYHEPGFYEVFINGEECDTIYFIDIIQIYPEPVDLNIYFAQSPDHVSVMTYLEDGNTIFNYHLGDGNHIFTDETQLNFSYEEYGIYDIDVLTLDLTNNCISEYKNIIVYDGTGNTESYVTYQPAFFSQETAAIGFSWQQREQSAIEFTADHATSNIICKWVFGDGAIKYGPNVIHAFPAAGIYKVTLYLYREDGSLMHSYYEYVEFTQFTHDLIPNFTYFAKANNEVMFQNLSYGNELHSFLWDLGDGNYSTEAKFSHFYATGGYKDVCLTIFNEEGDKNIMHCRKIYAGEEDTSIPEVVDCQVTINTLKTGENEDGTDYRVNVSIYPNPTHENFEYAWQINDEPFETESTSFTHTFENDMIHLLHFNITSDWCNTDEFAMINLTDDQGLKVRFGAIPMEELDKDVTSKPVKFKGITMGEPSQVSWDFGDGEENNTTMSPMHYFDVNVVYNVCVNVFNSTTEQSDEFCKEIIIVETDTTSINDMLSDISIKCYPNPVNDILNIEYDIMGNSWVNIEIFDMYGRKVKDIFNGRNTEGTHRYSEDINDMPNGAYFIQISTDNSIFINKIIKR